MHTLIQLLEYYYYEFKCCSFCEWKESTSELYAYEIILLKSYKFGKKKKKMLDGRKNSKESTKQQPGKCTGSLSCDGRLICNILSIVLLENSWSHSKNGLYL